jgi:hypothetical protein
MIQSQVVNPPGPSTNAFFQSPTPTSTDRFLPTAALHHSNVDPMK